MLALELPARPDGLSLLAVGSHCDDIEIGCGGTLLHLARTRPNLRARWVVLAGADGDRAAETRTSARRFLAGAASVEVTVCEFRDGFLPYSGAEVKGFFERLKADVAPDLVFTHRSADLHQDHRFVCELTWNTFRDHLILEYEIPKYDGDLGSPNVFVPLEEEICARKIDILMAEFSTQVGRDWFTPDVFRSVLRLRGIEARSRTGLAEGFHCRKITL